MRAEMTAAFTDARAKLEQLEALGLEAAVVSVSPALLAYETDEDRGAALCRAVNAGLAELCTRGADHGGDAAPLVRPMRGR